jgi:hypothetical protein
VTTGVIDEGNNFNAGIIGIGDHSFPRLTLIALIPRGNFAILVINACGNLPPVSTTPVVL